MKGTLLSKNLEAFHSAAQLLHFGRSAEALCITASALSQRIASLEEQLGTRLFERNSAGIQLTEAGERLQRYCLVTHGLQDELLHDLLGAEGQISGAVTVAGFSSAVRSVLMPCLRDCLLKNPTLRVHFVVADMLELRDKLLRGHADFILTHLPLDRCGYRSLEIGVECNVLVEGTAPGALTEVYLDHNQADDFSETFLRRAKSDLGAIKRGFCHDIYGILDAVGHGFGRGVVPLHLLEPGMAIRQVADYPQALMTPVYLQYAEAQHRPKAQRLVAEILKTQAGAYFERNALGLAYQALDRRESHRSL
ncbi:MAG: LysR family transcriptional regulator [Gammaproteobacteria bacterium]|nr:LysR family transcriptional regulator [Gammaproteobacteria bacterium]